MSDETEANNAGTTLCLDSSRIARAFGEKESLWTTELDQLNKLLADHLTTLGSPGRAASERSHEQQQAARESSGHRPARNEGVLLSIAIFGDHGSGKSSLLQTFVNRINDMQTGSKHPRELEGVRSLPILEPNLADDEEHFLYSFLATVWQRLEERHGEGQWDAEILSPAERSFQQVSRDLRVIDRAKTTETDPLGVSLERLEQHSSGPRLKRRMKKLISELVVELCENSQGLIVLPVDDADMSFTRLVTILDSYRRYLQHPRLVPVFTFTSVLAEELLQVHFAEKLRVKESNRKEPEGLLETYSRSRMTRRMAAQYLARLFPTRNRIRLRLGAARVQKADYTLHPKPPEGYSPKDEPRAVKELLKDASLILFGHPKYPDGDPIRRVLLPSTLRRQLQVVDMLAYTREIGIVREACKSAKADGPTSQKWADAFDNATWAVLDTHRELLAQLRLNIENLYGWTRQGLRRHVLEAILALPLQTRLRLIQDWSRGSGGRRSELLSLLAMQVARLPVEGAEDFTYYQKSEISRDAGQPRPNIAVSTGFLWFLNVCFGFYLPLIVASQTRPTTDHRRNEKEGDSRPADDSRPVEKPVWDLVSGAEHAFHEAVDKGTIPINGMFFFELEKKDLSAIRGESRLLADLWCFYGTGGEKPWGVFSLWRGLGLMGRVLLECQPWEPNVEIDLGEEDLERVRPHLNCSKKLEGSNPDEMEIRKGILRIEALIEDHCRKAIVPPTALRPGETSSFQELPSPREKPDPAASCREEPDCKELADARMKLAERLYRWRVRIRDRRIDLRWRPKKPDGWKNCFIRRLHGEYVLGHLARRLSLAHTELNAEQAEEQPEARQILTKWIAQLLEYWEPQETAREPQETAREPQEPSQGPQEPQEPQETPQEPQKPSQESQDFPLMTIHNLLDECPLLRDVKDVSSLLKAVERPGYLEAREGAGQ